MLCLLWPALINPVMWFSLDIPIVAGCGGVLYALSSVGAVNPILVLLVLLFLKRLNESNEQTNAE